MSEEKDSISAGDVLKLVEAGKSPSLIDVREDEEVAAGKIPSARHIPMGEVPERLDEIDQGEEHIIICRSGRRSGQIAEFLRSQGYDAKNMSGGMIAWPGDVAAE